MVVGLSEGRGFESYYRCSDVVKMNDSPPAERRRKKLGRKERQKEQVRVAPSDKRSIPVDSATVDCDKQVFKVYDQIAHHFSHTRYKRWPKVWQFVSGFPVGSIVVDVGCGNGKYLAERNKPIDEGSRPAGSSSSEEVAMNQEAVDVKDDLLGKMTVTSLWTLGTDRSPVFCEIAADRTGSDTFVSDCSRDVSNALRPGVADGAISIAVIHHIPTEDGRLNCLLHMARLLRIGGQGLVYAWAMEQVQGSTGARKFQSQDVLVPWHLQKRYETSKNAEQYASTVGATSNPELITYHRYYHVFTADEFRTLFSKVPGIRVDEIYFDSNNWAARFTKVSPSPTPGVAATDRVS
ncbi:Alkylated DNA repair protein alkB 8, variant 4 [Perkinsus olseni]|uniref:Alkylated DNA repair protein alkB 8, variant 4 n=2 Tax=Perkinsus olseni TaxID=32597 RepID=A0A7J6NDN9_PEROL|nr:Alkylated DNA repair protein alkB 8, variant 4 [Perkinsus olseni]